MAKNVVILNFSGRNSGNCSAISQYISDHYKNTNVCLYHIDQQFGTCGGCNYECLTPGVVCPNVTAFQKEVMDSVCASDITYYIVPNYCGLPSGNYFAFNERSVGYFNMDRELTKKYQTVTKRFIFISNKESDYFTQAMRQQTNQEVKPLYMKTGNTASAALPATFWNPRLPVPIWRAIWPKPICDTLIIAYYRFERNKIFILLRSLRV